MTGVKIKDNFKADSSSDDEQTISISNNRFIRNNRSIPTSWYKQIVWDNNKPDSIAMTILSEVMLLHELYGNLEFHLGYKYFQSKFNYSRNQIRDALVRLEKSNLVKRDYRTVKIHNRKLNNEMFLVLNLSQIKKLQASGALL